ncbi:MAG TPA: TIM barrel protein [Pyrinomonadaceae bacterium]|nr:TIM barrel protein [Pyrinomonadaceae bacterium]
MNTPSNQIHVPAKAGTSSRREFLCSTPAVIIAGSLKTSLTPRSYGIAYTSFPIRINQSALPVRSGGHSLPAEKFIDLVRSFGGDGCQMDVAQLSSTEADYLNRIRTSLEMKEMFLELSISGRVLKDEEGFSRVATVAKHLGVTRLRVAFLGGRRYEEFAEMKQWEDFAAQWPQALKRIEPVLKRHRLLLGVENHKDWLADDLAEMLRRISSPYLGACIDFGNNLALLEDSMEVAQKLAPYVVTTHLKDMAISPYQEGFELSEVPLGDGFLPLSRIIGIIRQARPDVHFCLEMITRDPLKVPYLGDKYWVTYKGRDVARIRKFENRFLKRASGKTLPRITNLTIDRRLAVEDENVRRSTIYAKKALGL